MMAARTGSWAATFAIAALCACGSSDDKTDTRQQALGYAKDDIACTTSTDCCAVLDGCMAQLLIVGAADKGKVEELLASSPQDPCVGCISPAVQVDCVGGICVGIELVATGSGSMDNYPSEFAKTHCGKMTPPAGWEESTTPQSWQDDTEPGLTPAMVIGCH